MGKNLFVMMLLSLAVFCSSRVFVETICAEQLSADSAYWEDEIKQGSPARLEENNLPSQEDLEHEMLLRKDVEYRMLQEKHRLRLLVAIVVSTPILLVIILFCLKNAPNCSGESLVNAVGLVLVIEGTMFIAVSAVTTEQLTALIGILGAIAGYLFGSVKRRTTESS
ncbi:MAG: hypothetical protein KJ804_05250 [Proteobacteria bacterium]|nr:hypothetical protein [Pseudomonadota bacterium]MBU1057710.1 hypothetical protein [Pseudomonadota bacterium]